MEQYRKAVENYLEEPCALTLLRMQRTRAALVDNLQVGNLRVDEGYRDNRHNALLWMPLIELYVRKHPGCTADDLYCNAQDARGNSLPDTSMYLALHYLVVVGRLVCNHVFYEIEAPVWHTDYTFFPRHWWQHKWNPQRSKL